MVDDRALFDLYQYFLFASDLRERADKYEPPPRRALLRREVATAVILRAMNERVWAASLYAVVEGWNGLKLNVPCAWEGRENAAELSLSQAQINALLASPTGKRTVRKSGGPDVDETFEDLLRHVRNKVFHFEPSRRHDHVGRFAREAWDAPRRWPQQLHEAFRVFFVRWARSHRQLQRH